MSLTTYMKHQVGQSPEDYQVGLDWAPWRLPMQLDFMHSCDPTEYMHKYYNKSLCDALYQCNALSSVAANNCSVRLADQWEQYRQQVDAQSKKSQQLASTRLITPNQMQATASINPITLSQMQARALAPKPSQPIRRVYPVRGRR